MDVLNEGTDEEYVPHDSPSPTPKTPRRKQKRKNTNKENGEDASKASKKGSVECPTCHKTFLSKYYLKVHNRCVCLFGRVVMDQIVKCSISLDSALKMHKTLRLHLLMYSRQPCVP